MTIFALEIIQLTIVVGKRNEIALPWECYSFLLSTLMAIYNWKSVCRDSNASHSQKPRAFHILTI